MHVHVTSCLSHRSAILTRVTRSSEAFDDDAEWDKLFDSGDEASGARMVPVASHRESLLGSDTDNDAHESITVADVDDALGLSDKQDAAKPPDAADEWAAAMAVCNDLFGQLMKRLR